jgi:hypothetical protein
MSWLKWWLLALLGTCGACAKGEFSGSEAADRLVAAVCDTWNRCEGRPADECTAEYERLTGEGMEGVTEAEVESCEDSLATADCGDTEWHEWLYQPECDLWG